jgi:transposase
VIGRAPENFCRYSITFDNVGCRVGKTSWSQRNSLILLFFLDCIFAAELPPYSPDLNQSWSIFVIYPIKLEKEWEKYCDTKFCNKHKTSYERDHFQMSSALYRDYVSFTFCKNFNFLNKTGKYFLLI